MRSLRVIFFLFVSTGLLMSAQALPAAPAQGGGRGGGPGAVAAALFAEKCAGCHGTDVSGGRAASLFDQKLLARLDDDRLARIIRAGWPAAGRGKLNKNNEWTSEQRIFRAPPELYTTAGAHFGLRFL